LIKICKFERLSDICCDCFRLIDREYQRQLTPFAQSGSPVIETEMCEPALSVLD
jgi:hypothetical protein